MTQVPWPALRAGAVAPWRWGAVWAAAVAVSSPRSSGPWRALRVDTAPLGGPRPPV